MKLLSLLELLVPPYRRILLLDFCGLLNLRQIILQCLRIVLEGLDGRVMVVVQVVVVVVVVVLFVVYGVVGCDVCVSCGDG